MGDLWPLGQMTFSHAHIVRNQFMVMLASPVRHRRAPLRVCFHQKGQTVPKTRKGVGRRCGIIRQQQDSSSSGSSHIGTRLNASATTLNLPG